MAFDDKKTININTSLFVSVISVTLVMLFSYLYLRSNNFESTVRLNAPQGQTLYVLSKMTALCVYILMWWQIMLGIFKRLNKLQHIILGTVVIFFVITHIVLFVSAISLRQNELTIGVLLPDFTSGYYQSALSLGVVAFLCIMFGAVSGALRNVLSKYWKLGHGLTYIAFLIATIHGLMIGSEVASSLLSYIIYGAVFSLILGFYIKTVKNI